VSASGDLEWRVSRTCETGACIMVARNGEFVVIGNTASPAGPISKFTADEWRHFVAGVKQGDFDGIVQDLLSFEVMSRRVARRLINFCPSLRARCVRTPMGTSSCRIDGSAMSVLASGLPGRRLLYFYYW